jgi:DNA-binding MarR family transcriptional regulator
MDLPPGLATMSASRSADDPAEIVSLLLHAATRVRLKFAEFLAVLFALGAAGADGLSQSDVAEQLMFSESNVSSLVDRLDHDGLVDRAWSTKDRRKRILVLSARGGELLNRIESARQHWSHRMMGVPPLHARESLIGVLNQLGVGARSPELRPALSREAESPAAALLIVPPWKPHAAASPDDPNSPHFALERMLSSLGLSSRLTETPQ